MAVLYISPDVAHKIINDHEIEPAGVEDAVVCVRRLSFVWDYDAERGWRALVKSPIRRRRALVVLYRADLGDPDVWNLGSAYFIDGT